MSSSVSAFWVELFDPRDGQFDVSQILAKDLGFLPVPILITEPAIGFGGLGQTADAIGNLGSDGTEKTVGGGFRYLIARRLGLRTGIDVARGPEEWTLYFQVGNAW